MLSQNKGLSPITNTTKALLVYVNFAKSGFLSEDLAEFHSLVVAAGALVVADLSCRRGAPDPRYFIGSGKINEIYSQVLAQQADVVIFNLVEAI